MSRIIAKSGERVRQGELIGYVGSTGLSTGPHLHYEMYRNGKAINPTSMKFTTVQQLAGRELANFRSKLNSLLSVRVANSGGTKSGKNAEATAEESVKDKPRKG